MPILEESPPDPATPRHRSASVRLSGGWKELGETVMEAAAAALAEQLDHDQPPPVVAFFPLPDEPVDAAPPSPRTTRKVVEGPIVDLTIPTIDDAVKTRRHMKKTVSALASEEASDAAKVDVDDLVEDTDFSSVGTVASREFSEDMVRPEVTVAADITRH